MISTQAMLRRRTSDLPTVLPLEGEHRRFQTPRPHLWRLFGGAGVLGKEPGNLGAFRATWVFVPGRLYEFSSRRFVRHNFEWVY